MKIKEDCGGDQLNVDLVLEAAADAPASVPTPIFTSTSKNSVDDMTDRQIQWPDTPLRRPKPLLSDILTWPDGVTVNEKAWYQRMWRYDENDEKFEVRGDPRPKPKATGDLHDDAISMFWYEFQEKHIPNVWMYRPAKE